MTSCLIPSMHRLSLLEHGIYQDDNAPCHRSALVKKWFETHNIRQLQNWPPQSPDLNPIENLWDYCDRQLRKQQFKK
jgi:transposase